MMRRIGTAFVGFLAALLVVVGVYAIDARRDHDAASMTLQAVPPAPTGAHYEPEAWTDTVFVLLIGSDERAGLEGARADALHVVGFNPGAKQATILNIPRDTWVDIPGRGQGRVNEAYELGGAQLQAETVRRLTGAPIAYALTTTFAGVVAMVDTLGGLNVDVPYLMDDPNSGAAFEPGLQRLNGSQVLAFSRNRHIPDGDLVRTAHQGQLVIHALSDLQGKGTSGSDIIRYLDVLYRNVRTVGMSPRELFRLGRAALAVPPGNVRNYVIPATVGKRGRMSVVFVRQPEASRLFVDFADDGILQNH